MRKHRSVFSLLLCTMLVLPAYLQAQVMQVSLQEMIQASGMIFAGTVVEVKAGKDERGDIATWTTFRVETPVRGVVPGTVTIKQFGGTSDEGSMVLAHMRYFNQGERVLLMLYPPSELGFTSPIGMGQGVWSVNDNGMIAGVTGELLGTMSTLAAQHGVVPDAAGHVPMTNMVALIEAATKGGK